MPLLTFADITFMTADMTNRDPYPYVLKRFKAIIPGFNLEKLKEDVLGKYPLRFMYLGAEWVFSYHD